MKNVNVFVGNLPFSVTEQKLRQLFEQFGEVTRAEIIADPHTGRKKGYAFVEMREEESARAAISGMKGKILGGRTLTVNEGKPIEQRVEVKNDSPYSSERPRESYFFFGPNNRRPGNHS